MPSSTVEDYIKCVYLAGSGREPPVVAMGELASRMSVQPGTATTMVKTLAENGLVDYRPYAGVQLTDAGRTLAVHVIRRHRLIELFLEQVLGLDWAEVHAEAERLEHAVSDRLIERMDQMLGRPQVDPHGDAIPSASLTIHASAGRPLSTLEPGHSAKLLRVLDQRAAFLSLLSELGLKPGVTVHVVTRSELTGHLELGVGDKLVSLALTVAGNLFVDGQ